MEGRFLGSLGVRWCARGRIGIGFECVEVEEYYCLGGRGGRGLDCFLVAGWDRMGWDGMFVKLHTSEKIVPFF